MKLNVNTTTKFKKKENPTKRSIEMFARFLSNQTDSAHNKVSITTQRPIDVL